MRVVVIIIVISIFCSQCSQHSTIVYEGKMTAEKDEYLAVELLNESFLFSWPEDLMILDSLLVVHDSYQQVECFHIFRKTNGEFIKSFGKKGRGPGEFMDIGSVNNNYDGSITVYDPNYKKIVVFDIIDILQDQKPSFKEYVIVQAPNFIKQTLLYKTDFIVKGNDDKLRYGFWNPSSGVFRAIYSDYPCLAKDEEDNWALTDYGVKVRLSPDGKVLAAATYIGGILELFNTDDDGFKLKTERFFFEPRYNYAQGAKPRWITTSSESIIGFEDLCLTNDAIYGLVWGVESPMMENSKPHLFCFDFDGNPVKSYMLDEELGAVAVDNDGTIYGVGGDSVGQYKLCKYTPIMNEL